jgi:hypothetical protein
MHIEKEYMLTGDRQEKLAAVAASLMKVWEALPQEKGQDWMYTPVDNGLSDGIDRLRLYVEDGSSIEDEERNQFGEGYTFLDWNSVIADIYAGRKFTGVYHDVVATRAAQFAEAMAANDALVETLSMEELLGPGRHKAPKAI